MSQYKVKKLDHPIHCTVEVPGSKSITNRALLMAALSQGECTLSGVLFSDELSTMYSSCQYIKPIFPLGEIRERPFLPSERQSHSEMESMIA